MHGKTGVIGAAIVAMVVSGCATTGQEQTFGSGTAQDGVARCAAMGVGGAVLGALIAGRHGAAKGAMLGIAACAVVEVASRQTKNAAQVDQQYRMSSRNALPSTPKLDAYTTVVTPNGAAKPGDAIRVRSTIRVVSGSSEQVQEVREVLTVYAPGGEEFKRGEKKVNETAGSGEFENSFTLRLPEGAPQGAYKLRTQVYVNGKLANAAENSLQIAGLLPSNTLAMLSH